MKLVDASNFKTSPNQNRFSTLLSLSLSTISKKKSLAGWKTCADCHHLTTLLNITYVKTGARSVMQQWGLKLRFGVRDDIGQMRWWQKSKYRKTKKFRMFVVLCVNRWLSLCVCFFTLCVQVCVCETDTVIVWHVCVSGCWWSRHHVVKSPRPLKSHSASHGGKNRRQRAASVCVCVFGSEKQRDCFGQRGRLQ